MTTYVEKLKDPRWQRRSLEVMQNAGFRCEGCGSESKTLHVHHKVYTRGAEPWEYTDGELICLCEDCHGGWHVAEKQFDWALQFIGQAGFLEVVAYAINVALRSKDIAEADAMRAAASATTYLERVRAG